MNLAALVLLLGMGLIAYRLVDLQVVKADRFKNIAEEQRYQLTDLNPRRGCILDREGEVLAISKEAYSIYATPYLVEDAQLAAAELSLVLQKPREEVEEKLRSSGGFVYLERKVSPEVAEEIEALDLAGIGLEKESKRYYPQGALAAQVIGFVGTDNVGLSGLELQYDADLAGEAGEAGVELDPMGEPIPGVTEMIASPVDGRDIQLTIDAEIQFKLQEQLAAAVEESGARSGSGLVMDCSTGEILAMAVIPDFDLNLSYLVPAEITRTQPVTDAFEPGSVLKILTAMASLQEQVVAPGSVINVPRSIQIGEYEFTDDHPMPKSDMTFTEIIAYSSNIGTIKTAQALGKEALSAYIEKCGLGELTGIDFPGENPGMVPELENWSLTSLPTIAIGQGISVSPLQLAVLTAAVANGGTRVTPHFLLRKIDADNGFEDYQAPAGERIISENAAASLRYILEEVVRMGTGSRAAMTLYNCAGKTGTAMKPDPAGGYREAYVATFAGLAPSDDPRLVAVITLDEPGTVYGGVAAAPCFSQVMEFSLQHLQVTPSLEKVNTKDKVVAQ
ncbi:MAG: penicillin-binding protein 2 [Actinobacteria bacterium]|jgi:cell division protein FtsI (penicillin-binding protein 3)|nr:MAG: penicillin-binding protein 2 [Actinomycetota bacterium]